MIGQGIGKPFAEGRILYASLIALAVLVGALLDEDSLGDALFGRSWDLDWPYGYYIFLRFVVCIASVIVAVYGRQWNRRWVPWVFGLQALLYNPIFRIHLDVKAWVLWNIVAIVLFTIGIFVIGPSARKDESES